MYEAVIERSRAQLASLWTSQWGGRIDMEDNWIGEGSRFVSWEVKVPRAQDTWAFSMTLALVYGGISQKKPQELAIAICDYLNPLAEAGWHFKAENGYINAYFEPTKLIDYLRRFQAINRGLLSGSYGLYRLAVIRQALESRGILPAPDDCSLCEDTERRIGELLIAPESDEDWKKWIKRVEALTSEGKLFGMQVETEAVLLSLIKKLEI